MNMTRVFYSVVEICILADWNFGVFDDDDSEIILAKLGNGVKERERVFCGVKMFGIFGEEREEKLISLIVFIFFLKFRKSGKWKINEIIEKLIIYLLRGRGRGGRELLKRGLLKFRPQFCDITRGNFDELRNLTKGKLMNLSGYYRILYSEINE